MNKVIFTLLFAVAMIAIYGAYTLGLRIEKEEIAEDIQTQIISVSMICNDDSYFIAEFPTSTSLQVIVDGELVRTLPQVEGYGYRFEDADYTYVFAGEGVAVTNKSTNIVTTCAQPFDPNLAPFNFGDAGEGSGDAGDIVKLVAESLVDRWQSTDDTKRIREFSVGIFVDYSDNSKVRNGTWNAYISEEQEASIALGEEQLVHLDITTFENGESTTEHFVVKKITPETLELANVTTKEKSTYNRI